MSSQEPTSNIDDYGAASITDSPSAAGFDGPIREQDRLLPIANVARIMKTAVPTNAKVAKDAKETVQECVSEFIAFVTSEAAERCQQEKRKTVNGEDIVWAMENLGFDQYAHLMKIYLQKYKEVTKASERGAGRGSGRPSISSENGLEAYTEDGDYSAVLEG